MIYTDKEDEEFFYKLEQVGLVSGYFAKLESGTKHVDSLTKQDIEYLKDKLEENDAE